MFQFLPFLYERFNSNPNLSFVDKLIGNLSTTGTSIPFSSTVSPVS
jgi:hypothetical protein